jgi:hypothetical protein
MKRDDGPVLIFMGTIIVPMHYKNAHQLQGLLHSAPAARYTSPPGW